MIKHIIKSTILTFVFVGFATSQKMSDSDILQRAIRDELNRCMDSLKTSDCAPVFMDFGLSYNRSYQVLSSLGGVVFSNNDSGIDFSSRLMAGSYQVNDENYAVKTSNQAYEPLAVPQTFLPDQPNYWPVRNVLWSSAENVFSSACKSYQEKLSVLAANNKTIADYKLADFSIAPIVNHINNANDGLTIDSEKWKDLSKTLSAEFKNYPDVVNSIVYIGSYLSDYHFINSEGTTVKMPLRITKIIISAVARQNDKSSVASAISFMAVDGDDLPNSDSLLIATRSFTQKLIASLSLPVIDAEYDGPILYQDLAASELFQEAMFRSSRFITKREEMSDDQNAFYMPDKPSANTLERKMGRLVVDKSLTVSSLSSLKNYQGVDLLGAFDVDAEGVRPPDTLVFVEEGKLKNLLNTRVPTFTVAQSNGHKRVYVTNRGIATELAPGVVMVKTNSGLSMDQLKSQLIAKAIEADLDYAYIIRKNNVDCPFYALFRVDLKTGAETSIRYFSLPAIALDDLKDDVLFGNQEIINNSILGRQGFLKHEEGGNADVNDGNGLPVSFITPNAVLVDKHKLTIKTERDIYKTPVVPSPLAK